MKSAHLGASLGQAFVESLLGAEEYKHVQKDTFKGDQYLGSPKGKVFLNDPITTSQVAIMGQGEEERRQEVDRCLREEGGFGETSSASRQEGAPHAPVQLVGGGVGSHAPVVVEGTDGKVGQAVDLCEDTCSKSGPLVVAGSGSPVGPNGGQAHLSQSKKRGSLNKKGVQLKFQDLSFSVSSTQRDDSSVPNSFPLTQRGDGGASEKPIAREEEVRKINQHIRFFSEGSDNSEFSDSIEDFEGDEQRI